MRQPRNECQERGKGRVEVGRKRQPAGTKKETGKLWRRASFRFGGLIDKGDKGGKRPKGKTQQTTDIW